MDGGRTFPLPNLRSLQTDANCFSEQNVLGCGSLPVSGEGTHHSRPLQVTLKKRTFLMPAVQTWYRNFYVINDILQRSPALSCTCSKAAGLDHDVGEAHIPHTACRPGSDGQTGCSGDDAVFHQNIRKVRHASVPILMAALVEVRVQLEIMTFLVGCTHIAASSPWS